MMNENVLGLDPVGVFTAADKLPHKLGTVMFREGKGYRLVLADEDLAAGKWVVIGVDGDYKANELDKGNDTPGDMVGVAETAIDDEEYGWVTVYGPVDAFLMDDAAAGVPLYAQAAANAGELDDAADGIEVIGAVAAEAEDDGGGSGSLTPCFIDFPRVRLAVDADT